MQECANEEQSKKEEINITLGTEFKPFKQTPLNKTYILMLKEDLIIPIKIGLIPGGKSKAENITPFSPEGYAVTNEDFDLKSRKEKLKKMQEMHIDPRKAPFFLFANADEYELNRSGINKQIDSDKNALRKYRFPQETLELLQMLKLQVLSSKGNYEAKPEMVALSDGALYFPNFYPIDAGPLASNPKEDLDKVGIMFVDEGHNLRLPASPKQLATIRMKFVLARDTPKEAAAKNANLPL